MYDIDFKNLKKGKGFGMTFFGFGLFFFCMMFGMIINIFLSGDGFEPVMLIVLFFSFYLVCLCMWDMVI